MKVIANGQEIPVVLSDEKNLKDVLVTLLTLTNQADKLVAECKVNGEAISLFDREKYCDVTVEDIKTVEILVESKSQRVIGTLEEIERIIPPLITTFGEVSNSLIGGQKHKALTLFAQGLENWKKVVNFLRIIEASYNIKFSEVEINGKKMDTANDELYAVLNEIKKAVENEDLVTISDLVEYELKTKLEEQKNIVTELKNVVHEEAQKLEQQIP